MTTLATIDISGLRARSTPPDSRGAAVRWRVADVEALFALPFMDLLHQAQQVHRENFDPNEVQIGRNFAPRSQGGGKSAIAQLKTDKNMASVVDALLDKIAALGEAS